MTIVMALFFLRRLNEGHAGMARRPAGMASPIDSQQPVRTVITRLAEIAQSGAIGGLLAMPILAWALGPGAPAAVLLVGLPLIPVGLIASFLLRNARPNRALGGALFIGGVVLFLWFLVFVR